MSSTHDANAAGRKLLAKIPISVRWRDMDSMGHVNNAKYISYLEEARVRWMLTVPDVSMTDRIAPVVAANNINYKRPLTWPNDVVVVWMDTQTGHSAPLPAAIRAVSES